jgi:hypothetical protein
MESLRPHPPINGTHAHLLLRKSWILPFRRRRPPRSPQVERVSIEIFCSEAQLPEPQAVAAGID